MEDITLSGKTHTKSPSPLPLSPSIQHVLELWPTRSKVATRNSRREQIILGQQRTVLLGAFDHHWTEWAVGQTSSHLSCPPEG